MLSKTEGIFFQTGCLTVLYSLNISVPQMKLRPIIISLTVKQTLEHLHQEVIFLLMNLGQLFLDMIGSFKSGCGLLNMANMKLKMK